MFIVFNLVLIYPAGYMKKRAKNSLGCIEAEKTTTAFKPQKRVGILLNLIKAFSKKAR